MNKFKYLFKNIGLLTLSNFGTRFLSFFLVPLYTYVLTTEEYGTYDLIYTTISLLIPILTLNILEAVLRFSIDDSKHHKDIFSEGVKLVVISLVFVVGGLVINHVVFTGNPIDQYSLYFLLMYIVTAFFGIMSNFARGLDKIKEVSIAGVLGSFVVIVLNILLLLTFKLGIVGYFLANIIGISVQTIYLFISCKAYKYINRKVDSTVSTQMRAYSTPMIANSIGWWVNNVSDRYIVTWICGVAANGIYSVAYKIPSILTIFQGIFNQAWTLSAVKDYDKDDSSGFLSQTYNLYNFAMILICSGLIAFSRFLAHFLYHNEFYVAWKYVPFLLISVVFGAMSGYVGGIFSAVKNSKIYSQSTVAGAVVNLFFNFVLVYFMGPIGAAISTAISYFVIWVIRIIKVKEYVNIKMNVTRDLLAYSLLVGQSLILLATANDSFGYYGIQFIVVLVIIALYKQQVVELLDFVFVKVLKIKK